MKHVFIILKSCASTIFKEIQGFKFKCYSLSNDNRKSLISKYKERLVALWLTWFCNIFGVVKDANTPPQDGGGVANTNLVQKEGMPWGRERFGEQISKLMTSVHMRYLKLFISNKVMDKMIIIGKMPHSGMKNWICIVISCTNIVWEESWWLVKR